jgi:hypothetical protein
MGKEKAAGHRKGMEIDRELLSLRSTVNSASRYMIDLAVVLGF